MKKLFTPSFGFTLIEIMVVVAIMMLMMTGGIAAYIRLNSRQTLLTAGSTMQLLLRTAQKQARVGSKPAGCPRLVAYAVESKVGVENRLFLSAQCENAASQPSDQTIKIVYHPPGIVNTSAYKIRFLVLYGGVVGPSSVGIRRGSQTLMYSIGPAGEISEGVLQ